MAGNPVEAWARYSANEATPYWILQELSRKEAQAHFARTMATKSARVRELRTLLLSGFGIELRADDSSVQSLNRWFVDAMTPLPSRAVPDGVSLSVCEDVALFLGDVMISRHPELRWDLFTWGKRNVSYHSHVIMGFPFEDPKLHTNLDLPGIIHAYGVEILEDRDGSPITLHLPDGHPLNGVELPNRPLQSDKFVELLHRVDRRCAPQ